jgi:uncharacterized protein (TIGR03382 family)
MDRAGHTSEAVEFRFTVDTRAPTALKVLTPHEGDRMATSRPPVHGMADPGNIVQVSLDGSPIGTAVTNMAGYWSYVPSIILKDGEHTISVTAVDAAGNVSQAVARSFTVFTPASTGDGGQGCAAGPGEPSLVLLGLLTLGRLLSRRRAARSMR